MRGEPVRAMPLRRALAWLSMEYFSAGRAGCAGSDRESIASVASASA